MDESTQRESFELPGLDVSKQEVASPFLPQSWPNDPTTLLEYQVKLWDLQMLICELLLKNQKLRVSLAAMTLTCQENACERDGSA